jgi:hypothetical protein
MDQIFKKSIIQKQLKYGNLIKNDIFYDFFGKI